MNVCPDGEIAQFFKSGEFKLCPIIFSHGMKGSRCMYSTICQEMASHGYIVFALDHHDGSCPYTENKQGTQSWKFDVDAPKFSYDDLNTKLNIRAQEVSYLIDDITTDVFCKKALKIEGI